MHPYLKPQYQTGVTNRDLVDRIDNLVDRIDNLQQTVTRLETRLCKLIEHLGATHLIHQPAQKRKENAA